MNSFQFVHWLFTGLYLFIALGGAWLYSLRVRHGFVKDKVTDIIVNGLGASGIMAMASFEAFGAFTDAKLTTWEIGYFTFIGICLFVVLVGVMIRLWQELMRRREHKAAGR